MSTSVEYASFLIRLWGEQPADPRTRLAEWHCEVEHIQSGKRWTFGDVAGMLAFLQQQVDQLSEPRLLAS